MSRGKSLLKILWEKEKMPATSIFSFSHHLSTVYLLQNDIILDVTKLKVFADDKLNVAKMTMSVFDRAENTVGKGKMLVNSISPLFHSIF